MSVRIVLTMSRSYKEWSTVRSVLATIHERYPDAILDHGDCEKGDRQAAGIWRSLGGRAEGHPADWPTCASGCRPSHRRKRRNGEEYCPTAGMRRNVDMVHLGPGLVVVFLDPGSKTKGAYHCADYAADAGLPVMQYIQGQPGVVLRGALEDAAVAP